MGDGAQEQLLSLGVLAGVVKQRGQRGEGRDTLRRPAEGLAAQGDGLVVASLVPEEADETCAGRCVVGGQFKRAAQAPLSAGNLSKLSLDNAVEAEGLGVVRRNGQSALQQWFGVRPALVVGVEDRKID